MASRSADSGRGGRLHESLPHILMSVLEVVDGED